MLADPGVHTGVIGCVPLTAALATLPGEVDRYGGITQRLLAQWQTTKKAWIAVVDSGALYDAFAARMEAAGLPGFRSGDRAVRLLGPLCRLATVVDALTRAPRRGRHRHREVSTARVNWLKRLLGLSPSRQPASQPPAKAATGGDAMRRRFADQAQPAAHLRSSPSSAFSRLGGQPLLPPGIEWPHWNDEPLAFLAQLDLRDLHAAVPSFLPAAGFLYFFYDQKQSIWGFDPNDAGGWRVLYVEGDARTFELRPAPAGIADECRYRPRPVAAHRIGSLPDLQRLPDAAELSDTESEAYYDLRQQDFGNEPRHQVLGFPSPVQNDDMELECQLAANGVPVGNASGYRDARVKALQAGAADWRLLLQLDSDDDAGWMWGDVGMLYFWVREEDARRRDFSRVWMVLQCC